MSNEYVYCIYPLRGALKPFITLVLSSLVTRPFFGAFFLIKQVDQESTNDTKY